MSLVLAFHDSDIARDTITATADSRLDQQSLPRPRSRSFASSARPARLTCNFEQHAIFIPTAKSIHTPSTMKTFSLAVTALLAGQSAVAQNMLRFACSQLVVERTDPLVNPGMVFTPHLHQIVGGNGFNVTMDPNNDPATLSTCTSCSFVQDKSNYWTSVLFFKARNGSYHRVPQTGNGGPQGKLINNGGLDVYYIPSGKTTAFKKVCTQTQRILFK